MSSNGVPGSATTLLELFICPFLRGWPIFVCFLRNRWKDGFLHLKSKQTSIFEPTVIQILYSKILLDDSTVSKRYESIWEKGPCMCTEWKWCTISYLRGLWSQQQAPHVSAVVSPFPSFPSCYQSWLANCCWDVNEWNLRGPLARMEQALLGMFHKCVKGACQQILFNTHVPHRIIGPKYLLLDWKQQHNTACWKKADSVENMNEILHNYTSWHNVTYS